MFADNERFYFTEYSNYFAWIRYIFLFSIVLLPLSKLMFKATIYFIIGYSLLFWLFISPLYEYIMQYDSSNLLKILIFSFVTFIVLNIPGIFFNKAYLNKVRNYKGFKLVKTEVNKFSIIYVINKIRNI